MILRTNYRFLVGLSLAVVAGPLIAGATAEVALRLGWMLPLPSWGRPLTAVVVFGTPGVIGLAGATLAARLLRFRTTCTVLGYVLRSGTLLVIAAASLALVQLPLVNAFYDRYSQILSNTTHWATGFDDSKFVRVELGMAQANVLAMVGEPIARGPLGGGEVWLYAGIGMPRNEAENGFHQRAIVFIDGRVSRVYRRYLTADHTRY